MGRLAGADPTCVAPRSDLPLQTTGGGTRCQGELEDGVTGSLLGYERGDTTDVRRAISLRCGGSALGNGGGEIRDPGTQGTVAGFLCRQSALISCVSSDSLQIEIGELQGENTAAMQTLVDSEDCDQQFGLSVSDSLVQIFKRPPLDGSIQA